ncbi:MAG: tRNA (guanosine(37)-N1)-methyltransferase TrmD [Desulfitobacterium sp.]|nr:tRNA (guanosine(37)-N1)-methyltransferase TrmD [Desulfitobacterium sp.]
MKFTVLTLFPEMFAPLNESILKRAQQGKLIEVELINFREYAMSKHKNVDDIPYGGGAGMVLKPEPIYAAIGDLPETVGSRRIVLLTPQGEPFKQEKAQEWSQLDEIVFICGHYEGFDERIRYLADEEISLGDFVLTGGELAAMVMIDAVARLIPGVLGEEDSAVEDSHSMGALEYPHYTRPRVFEGMEVPEVLLSGHHMKIQAWRRKESLRRTFFRRPELFAELEFSPEDYPLLEELAEEYPELAEESWRWEHLKPKSKRRRPKKSP